MSASVHAKPLPVRAVEVRAAQAGAPAVAAIVVTWNRREAVDTVLAALARQDYARESLDVAVIDNGSTDGTVDAIRDRWQPETIIDNAARAAERPAFSTREQFPGRNRGAFRSLTVIRNARNLGGCGGFNTGFAWIDRVLLPGSGRDADGYAWLIDDDADVPPDALRRLVETAESDPSIGLVGSRTVDCSDRGRTTETTIYFDPAEGDMSPEPPPGHPMEESHRAWIAISGGTRGRGTFKGTRDVDIVSACSMLARWSAVRKVGYWDPRFFIYCDDADWCLRFRRAGYRVVCNLDAVVYHAYWLSKLTPARGYYAQRNLLWMMEKAMPAERLRRVLPRRFASILLCSRKAASHCRLFHAEILRRTVHDVITNRGGSLDAEGPAAKPVVQALDSIGALRQDAEILVMCSGAELTAAADDLRARVTHELIDQGRAPDQPRWTYVLASPGQAATRPHEPQRVAFEPNRRSKWRAQRRFLFRPPAATIVFDQANDFPLICSTWNIHVDRRRPGLAQVERDGLGLRARFLLRWAWTAVRAALYRPTARSGAPTR